MKGGIIMEVLEEKIYQETINNSEFYKKAGFEYLRNKLFITISSKYIYFQKNSRKYECKYDQLLNSNDLSIKDFIITSYLKTFDKVTACIKHPLGLIEQKYQLTEITPEVLEYCRKQNFLLKATKYELYAELIEPYKRNNEDNYDFESNFTIYTDILEHY